MWPNPQFPENLVTFTEKILNGKLHFLCSVFVNKMEIKQNKKIKQPGFRNVHMVFFKMSLQDLFTVTGTEKQNRYHTVWTFTTIRPHDIYLFNTFPQLAI